MASHQFRVRNGLLLCIVLLAFYFASIQWCMKQQQKETDTTPIVIHLNGFLKNPFGKENAPAMPIQEALRTTFLDNLVNGPRTSTKYIETHQNKDVLFFNRIPKTGSELIVLLLQWLQQPNEFHHYRLKNTVKRFLTFDEQLELAAEMGNILESSKERYLSFDRHIHFTNFTKVGLKMPLLINMVRDPVEKITSRFYYARITPRPGGFTPPNASIKVSSPRPYLSLEECVTARDKECTFVDGNLYDLTIPYFCGHQKYCRELNNIAALLTAKRNVEQWYQAVGVLEDLNSTFAVFEKRLPKFFKGVTDLYFEELQALHHNTNRQKPDKISTWVNDQIRYNLSMEYEFYYFIKQRLHNEFRKINKLS